MHLCMHSAAKRALRAEVHARVPAESVARAVSCCQASGSEGRGRGARGGRRGAMQASQASHEELAVPTWKDDHATLRTQHT